MGFVLPVIVAVIGVWIAFSIVVWATGRDTLLDLAPAGAPAGLGEEEPVSEGSIGALKFDTGARGYRTDQVDAALNRLAWEIGRRDEQLAALRAELEPGAEAEDKGEAEDRAEAEAEVLAAADEGVAPAGGPVADAVEADAAEAEESAAGSSDAGRSEADEPFEKPLDEGAFRSAEESGTDGDGAGREAGREDQGEQTPRDRS
ncbi:DivIVA domain-containing protein [Glycomyces sambucus]|uniref:DivIVA domain-containing protein n=1 Tax=Glycomyces sambucus TaxID=380244 RepID=A0A1G9KUX8_9ACTN|nr:DivIVA domain-containing protein [Glycomyces sambucus]SDL53416.1 DivIVA domain-containing protein [Glycomyces sambucus]